MPEFSADRREFFLAYELGPFWACGSLSPRHRTIEYGSVVDIPRTETGHKLVSQQIMLPAKHRLRLDNDIKRVLKSKRGVFDPVAGLKVVHNGLSTSRFAVVVPNKVSNTAVRRNGLRRQYREILRLHLDVITPGFDVLVLVSKPALELSYEEKQERLLNNLKKAKLIA